MATWAVFFGLSFAPWWLVIVVLEKHAVQYYFLEELNPNLYFCEKIRSRYLCGAHC
jgi:hypothetical protein